jgi:hypothetical protein
VSYQVNWEIQALDQAAGFLRDDPVGVTALWDSVSQLAPVIAMVGVDRFVDRATCANGAVRGIGGMAPWYPCS